MFDKNEKSGGWLGMALIFAIFTALALVGAIVLNIGARGDIPTFKGKLKATLSDMFIKKHTSECDKEHAVPGACNTFGRYPITVKKTKGEIE